MRGKKKNRAFAFIITFAMLFIIFGSHITAEAEVNLGDPSSPFSYADILDGDMHETGEITLVAYSGTDTKIVIPSTIDGKTVVGLDEFFLWERYDIEEVVLPDTLQYICMHAFSFTSITEIVIPEGVKSISDFAFMACNNLKKITLPSTLQDATGAFYSSGVGCLEEINVSEDNPYFTSSYGILFNKDKSILMKFPSARKGYYRIPESVEIIGYTAFEGSRLERVYIPDGVTQIGERAFSSTEIQGVFVPDTVEAFGDNMLDDEYVYKRPILLGSKTSNFSEYAKEKHYDYVDPAESFSDVEEDSFYYIPTLWASQSEPQITSGVGGNKFKPFTMCNRAQMITFLWKAMGCPGAVLTDNPFTDVSEDDFYFKAVMWAKQAGITSGKTATEFDPMGPCSRGQFVIFLWRACGQEIVESESEFSDVAPGTDLSKAVSWACKYGITSGVTATKFKPSTALNRAQAVTFLCRARMMINLYEK